MNKAFAIFLAIISVTASADEIKKVAELRFSGNIQKILYECSAEGPCVMYFEENAVVFNRPMDGDQYGLVYKPIPNSNPLAFRTSPYNSLPKKGEPYIGYRAEVYCRKLESVPKTVMFENVKGSVCSLIGSKDYYVKIYPNEAPNKSLKDAP